VVEGPDPDQQEAADGDESTQETVGPEAR
jgi:hypothetical protein